MIWMCYAIFYRCLLGQLQLQPKTAVKVIMACAVLHNIARRLGMPDVEAEEEEEEPDVQQLPDVPVLNDHAAGLDTRRRLVENRFTR